MSSAALTNRRASSSVPWPMTCVRASACSSERARCDRSPALGPALGDPDAVPVGDYHIPNTVSWALAGEPRGTDARRLELLEPTRGQRGRVIRLLGLDGHAAPAFGPRQRIQPMYKW